MKRVFSVTLVLVSFFPAVLYSQNKTSDKSVQLTFEAALNQMITSNEALKAAGEEDRQRKYEKYSAMGLYFPRIGVTATAVKMSDPVVMDLNDIRTAIQTVAAYSGNPTEQYAASQLPEFKRTVTEDELVKLDATIRGPLFTGGKITAANSAAKARIDESASKRKDLRNRLMTELSTRYFGLRFSYKVVEVRTMVLEGMQKHLDDSRALQRNGMIPNVELLHAKVAFADASRELKKAERDRDLAMTALKNTLSGRSAISPSTPMFIFSEIKPVDYFKKMASSGNPLLKQIKANRDLAHAAYIKERATYSPDIFYFGTYQLYGWQTPDDYLPKWTIGLGARATLFEGLSGYNKVRAAKAQEKRVAELESKARADILTLVEKNYHELMKALEQYHSIEASYRFAEEYLRVRDKAFSEGVGTSSDVVDARLALAKVRIERLKSVYDFDVALAALLESSGMSGHYTEFLHRKDVEVEF